MVGTLADPTFGGASREKISSRRRKSRLESRSHHKNDA
jgi:hypothetical protein